MIPRLLASAAAGSLAALALVAGLRALGRTWRARQDRRVLARYAVYPRGQWVRDGRVLTDAEGLDFWCSLRLDAAVRVGEDG